MMMKSMKKMALVRQVQMFGSGRRAYYVDTSVGFLLENIERVYHEKRMSGSPVISEKEFRSQQQLVLSGFYELYPFQVRYLNDGGVSDFLKRRECDLFGIAKNPLFYQSDYQSYMVSSIATKDELVLRGLALMIYQFTHYYSIEYENWVDGLLTNYLDKVKAIVQSNRLFRLKVKYPMLGGSISRCRILDVVKVYVEEDSVVYNLVKQFLYNDFLDSDGEDFPLHYMPDLGEITYAFENLLMNEIFEKAFDQKFPSIHYHRFLDEVLISCTCMEDSILFNERTLYTLLEEINLPGDILSIGPGDYPLSLYNDMYRVKINRDKDVVVYRSC